MIALSHLIKLSDSRTPELLYQPSMLALEQAGIAETIEYALTKFTADQQLRLCRVRFSHLSLVLMHIAIKELPQYG